MLTEAIVLAGGFGTRLRSVVSDVPKPMAPVNGQPFLNYLFNYLVHGGVKRIVLSTGYQEEKIREYYSDGSWNKSEIVYSHESEPLGTGGAIALAMSHCKTSEILVVNGDSFFDVPIKDFYSMHADHNAAHSIALRKVENASRYGAIEIENKRLTSFTEKSDIARPGVINGGVYILNKDLYLKSSEGKTVYSIEKDFFEKRLHEQLIYGFEFDGQFIDIGTPEDFNRAQDEFKHFKY